MYELRGISVYYVKNQKRITLTTRGPLPDQYKNFVFPTTLPLNRGQIRKFLGDHFGIPPGQVKWPPHVKVPGE